MSNRPTSTQLEALLEFLEQNPSVAKGLIRTSQGRLEIKRKWEQLATSLNSLGGVTKNGPGWAKYWAEKKCNLKRICSKYGASMRQTGGGVSHTFILSALDKRFVAVMGGQSFASGDSQLAVNPFPQTYSTPEVVNSVPPTSPIEMPEEVMLEVDDDIPPPPSSILGTPQEVQVPPHSSSAPRRRPRRLTCRSGNAELERMATMEERRIEAETTTAEALADIGRRLERFGNAAELIAQSLTEVANALIQISNNLAR